MATSAYFFPNVLDLSLRGRSLIDTDWRWTGFDPMNPDPHGTRRYTIGDLVVHEGHIWVAQNTNENSRPANGNADWQQLSTVNQTVATSLTQLNGLQNPGQVAVYTGPAFGYNFDNVQVVTNHTTFGDFVPNSSIRNIYTGAFIGSNDIAAPATPLEGLPAIHLQAGAHTGDPTQNNEIINLPALGTSLGGLGVLTTTSILPVGSIIRVSANTSISQTDPDDDNPNLNADNGDFEVVHVSSGAALGGFQPALVILRAIGNATALDLRLTAGTRIQTQGKRITVARSVVRPGIVRWNSTTFEWEN